MGEFYFSPSQIAVMAMSVEEEGATFYKILANTVDDQSLIDMFTALSNDELEHKEVFSRIAASFRQEDLNEYAVDVAMLMQTNLDKLKAAVLNMRNQPKNIQEALDIAINVEEESIRVYSEMHDVYIAKFHLVLSAIIDEEKRHLKKLREVKH